MPSTLLIKPGGVADHTPGSGRLGLGAESGREECGPYPPAEKRLRLTRRILEKLLDTDFHVLVLVEKLEGAGVEYLLKKELLEKAGGAPLSSKSSDENC